MQTSGHKALCVISVCQWTKKKSPSNSFRGYCKVQKTQTEWPGLTWPQMTIHISYAQLTGQTSASHFLFLQWPYLSAVAGIDTPPTSVSMCPETETLDRKHCKGLSWLIESSLMLACCNVHQRLQMWGIWSWMITYNTLYTHMPIHTKRGHIWIRELSGNGNNYFLGAAGWCYRPTWPLEHQWWGWVYIWCDAFWC